MYKDRDRDQWGHRSSIKEKAFSWTHQPSHFFFSFLEPTASVLWKRPLARTGWKENTSAHSSLSGRTRRNDHFSWQEPTRKPVPRRPQPPSPNWRPAPEMPCAGFNGSNGTRCKLLSLTGPTDPRRWRCLRLSDVIMLWTECLGFLKIRRLNVSDPIRAVAARGKNREVVRSDHATAVENSAGCLYKEGCWGQVRCG